MLTFGVSDTSLALTRGFWNQDHHFFAQLFTVCGWIDMQAPCKRLFHNPNAPKETHGVHISLHSRSLNEENICAYYVWADELLMSYASLNLQRDIPNPLRVSDKGRKTNCLWRLWSGAVRAWITYSTMANSNCTVGGSKRHLCVSTRSPMVACTMQADSVTDTTVR